MAAAVAGVGLAGGLLAVLWWTARVIRRQHATIARESAGRQEAVEHLRRVQDAMETTILERTRRLRDSEDRYRAIAEMSLDAVVVHAEGAIVFANRQAVAITGAETLADLIGQPLARYLPAGALAGGAAERIEVTLLRHDGCPVEAETSSTAITYGGRPAMQTIIRDVSDSKAVQRQLVQTAKLATLGEMAAGMAHELSQPMNVIRMAAEGVLLDHQRGGEIVPEPVLKALGIITSQAGRMGDIIDHMRIFSRKEAEGEEIFDPGLCVRQALNMVEAQFHAEDIAVTVRYPDGACLVRGRPVHLEQVLLNLLTNARDAIRARQADDGHGTETVPGHIAIDMQLAEGTADPPTEGAVAGRCLVITLTDTGGGIPGNTLDRIFEPFYTTKEVGTGTGLGLSVSFGLIAAMKGTITAANTQATPTMPAGARFDIRLPLAESGALPDAGAETVDRETRPGQDIPVARPWEGEDDEPSALRIHVLVVDDEPFAATLIADHLGHLGYRVTTAGDGLDAYDKFLADPPDLMITDLRMPRSDGAELMRRVHGHVPDLPVILVTGHLGHLEETSQALSREAVAVVKKPLSLRALAALVHRHAGDPAVAGPAP
jgi:PAS domain S-box-containing protein